MIRSAVTVSLVEAARSGPFVFHDDLPAACAAAAELGFDAVELFAPGPQAVDPAELRRMLESRGLALAAVGTGAGMVVKKLSLTDDDDAVRQKARDFVRSMIDFGGPFGAPAIIGSMQGKASDTVDFETAMAYLVEALEELGEHARQYDVPLLFEPLNRYETNLVCTIQDGIDLLSPLETDNVKLLADLFHMNIEEQDIAAALREGGGRIGHVHFVDSNRRPAGCGHTDFGPIATALRDIEYEGYASAEAFPYPDSPTAARLTIEAFNRCFS